ncbi:hypothetical protein SAMN06296386_103331 [Lachnospiraceae bacterium]|nr:hypothetical protein SAMN06296386_103331 [Lachnospiraceae bacterium]
MKEIIDDFLKNEKDVANFLDGLVGRYRLNDFVIVDRTTKAFLENRGKEGFEGVHGCMYYCRAKQLYLDFDSVESRLLHQYLDFLWTIMALEEEKVGYILAYHYLEMIKQWAFQLTISSDAPFLFGGTGISPRGENGYKSYKEVKYGIFHDMLPYISEESLVKYTRIFYKYCRDHHKVKHYSLMEYVLERENIFNIDWELEREFVDMLDLFLFRYKAVFTTETLHMYMSGSDREKVISNLVEI